MSTEDRYEVIHEAHGEGAFGRVAKRRDKLLERLVAVKQLKVFDEESKERFRREAKMLAKMSHPHIPAIYDVRFADERMEIYFAFVEGMTLRELIKQSVIPSMDQVRRWFTQVASALDHAHTLGIVHRDIKPDNIIVSVDNENALLVDFGIALTVDDVRKLTGTGYVIGTPVYMSPEQTQGDALDGRSDLYSLGITLYETLSGHLPHPGGYQPLADANEAIPPAIDTLIKECLAQDRNLRLNSAGEFVRRLRSAFRLDVPLSTLLTEARLHEVVGALRQMSTEDFAAKPKGQRLLLINRLKDLIRTDRPELQIAAAQVIALLTNLARLEGAREYVQIIHAAFYWGFEKLYGTSWHGQPDIREALIDTAKLVNSEAHHVLASEFITFLLGKDLTAHQRWFPHDLRLLVMSLLANTACSDTDAESLASLYDEINAKTHADPSA